MSPDKTNCFLAAAPASRFVRRNSFRGARVAAGCVLTGFAIGALLFGLLASRDATRRRDSLLRLDDQTTHTGAREWLNGRGKEREEVVDGLAIPVVLPAPAVKKI